MQEERERIQRERGREREYGERERIQERVTGK